LYFHDELLSEIVIVVPEDGISLGDIEMERGRLFIIIHIRVISEEQSPRH